MKQNKTYIPGGLLLLATLFYAASAQADVPSYITCGDYFPAEQEVSVRGGHIEAELVGGCWQITAVPDRGWRFVKWADNEDTNPVRSVSLDLETRMDTAFVANFTRIVVNNCFSSSEFSVKDETALETERGTITYRQLMDDSYELTATPKPGYTFVQWADGSFANPRILESISSADKDVSFYATFMETTPAQAVIDSWSATGFTLIADESEPITEAGALGTGGAITVFYGGDVAFCGLPTARKTDDGIYTVAASYSAELAGQKCHIVYKNADREPLAILDAYIPVLVSGTESDVIVPNPNTGVHVLEGGIATFATGQTMAELEVYAGGQAIIASEDTVASVVLHADFPNEKDPGTLLVLDGGKLKNNNNDTVYLDNKLYTADWYPFALPYTVNTEKAIYRSGHDAADHFVMQWYDGDARAKGNTAWKLYYDPEDPDYDDHQDIEGGKGYSIIAEQERWGGKLQRATYGGVIRFPMPVNLSEDGGEPAREVMIQTHESDSRPLRNWNLIGLPYLSAYRGDIYLYNGSEDSVAALKFITIPENGCYDYRQPRVGTEPIYPFMSFFVQFDNNITVDRLKFKAPKDAYVAPAPASAPARRDVKTQVQTQSPKELMAGISLSQNGKSDYTGLFISDEYTNGYDINGDLAKLVGKKERIRIFSMSNEQGLAYIAFPPEEGNGELETRIPLAYTKAQVGEPMTFAADYRHYPELRYSEDIVRLDLIDKHTGVTIDLLQDDYTCSATKTADSARFALNVVYRAPQQTEEQNTATSVDNLNGSRMEDGVYDLMGRRIDSALPRNAGVYIIIRNGKVRKEVVR